MILQLVKINQQNLISMATYSFVVRESERTEVLVSYYIYIVINKRLRFFLVIQDLSESLKSCISGQNQEM